MAKVNITQEQLDAILPYVPNAAKDAEDGFLGDILFELDAAIFKALKKPEYEATPLSRKLQDIYYELYEQNEDA